MTVTPRGESTAAAMAELFQAVKDYDIVRVAHFMHCPAECRERVPRCCGWQAHGDFRGVWGWRELSLWCCRQRLARWCGSGALLTTRCKSCRGTRDCGPTPTLLQVRRTRALRRRTTDRESLHGVHMWLATYSQCWSACVRPRSSQAAARSRCNQAKKALGRVRADVRARVRCVIDVALAPRHHAHVRVPVS